MAAVTSEAVAAYSNVVKRLATRYVGIANAEYDDLYQEGLISVWQALGRGLSPSLGVIEGRMVDWTRFLRRLENGDSIAYTQLLPIEDYNFEL